MNRLIAILLIGLFLTACGSKDIEPIPTIDTPYGLVLENCTEGEIMALGGKTVETAIFSWVFLDKPGDCSEVIKISKDHVLITWTGEGTHWSTRSKYVELEKDKVIKVELTPYNP